MLITGTALYPPIRPHSTPDIRTVDKRSGDDAGESVALEGDPAFLGPHRVNHTVRGRL